jgi:hypothetical protein
MITTREIIQQLWDAQGYGNIAVYDDGSTTLIPADDSGERAGRKLIAVFKPIRMVAVFPMVDFALADADLIAEIEGALREKGLLIQRG